MRVEAPRWVLAGLCWALLYVGVGALAVEGNDTAGLSVVGLYHGPHDSSVAVAIHGQLVLAFPLAMVFGQPCFGWVHYGAGLNHTAAWARTRTFTTQALKQLGHRAVVYDFAVIPVAFRATGLAALLGPARRAVPLMHHAGHALYGLYDSPFDVALVVTVDGGGDNEYFNVYLGNKSAADADGASNRRGIQNLLRINWNLGRGYAALAAVIPLVAALCTGSDHLGCAPPLAMDLASLGRPEERLMQPMRPLFRLPAARQVDAARGLARRLALAANATAQRAFAASAQAVLTERVTRFLDRVLPAHPVQGLVLSGGVAANAVLVSTLHERYRLPVHVPAIPGDAGLGIGFAYAVLRPRPPPYIDALGPPMPDLHFLRALRDRHNGTACRPADVAALLAAGHVVAVVRGRQPILDRSFGTRSLLAPPGHPTFPQRGRRAAFTPARCVVAADRLAAVARRGGLAAPAGWAAPELRPALARRHPHLADGRGRGRVTTVAQTHNGWLHAALTALGNATGLPLAMHTAFLLNGRLVHGVQEAWAAFQADAGVTHLVLEDTLFGRPSTDVP